MTLKKWYSCDLCGSSNAARILVKHPSGTMVPKLLCENLYQEWMNSPARIRYLEAIEAKDIGRSASAFFDWYDQKRLEHKRGAAFAVP